MFGGISILVAASFSLFGTPLSFSPHSSYHSLFYLIRSLSFPVLHFIEVGTSLRKGTGFSKKKKKKKR
jgi:hypothetical protein